MGIYWVEDSTKHVWEATIDGHYYVMPAVALCSEDEYQFYRAKVVSGRSRAVVKEPYGRALKELDGLRAAARRADDKRSFPERQSRERYRRWSRRYREHYRAVPCGAEEG